VISCIGLKFQLYRDKKIEIKLVSPFCFKVGKHCTLKQTSSSNNFLLSCFCLLECDICFNGNIFDPEKLFLERIAKQCHWLVHITTYLPDFCNRTTCNFDWPVKVKQVFIREVRDAMSALKC
jgi:hypothetical protein